MSASLMGELRVSYFGNKSGRTTVVELLREEDLGHDASNKHGNEESNETHSG